MSAVSVQAAPHLTRNYAYRYYSTRDGLAQIQVLSAFQDRDGYMWFGTKGGVSRFDGVTFKNYTSENGLPDGEVRTIAEWNGRKLFIYYNKIAILYENEKIETVNFPDSLGIDSNEFLTVDLSDENKIMFLDLLKRNQSSTNLHFYHLIWDIRTKRFQALNGFNKEVLDHNGKYFLTEDGLYLRTGLIFKKLAGCPQKFELYESDWSKMEFYLRVIDKSAYNKYRFTVNKFQFVEKIGLSNKRLNMFGDQCIKLPDNSFLFFDADKQAHFFPERQTGFGVNLPIIERLFVDREKNLWIATNNGLYNFFNLNMEEVKLNLADPDDIWSVVEDKDYNMWFGSYGKGLWKVNPKGKLDRQFSSLKYSELQYMGSSMSVDGTLFFPTAGGVIKYKKNNPVTLTNTSACLSTYFDEDTGKLLFSGMDSTKARAGLYCVLKTKRKFFPWNKGFPASIVKDKKGQIRIGSFDGQAIFRNDSIITDTRKHEYNGVICMSTDDKGRLWKGTRKGIYIENPDGSEKRISAIIITGQISSLMVYHDKYVLAGGRHSLFIIDLQHFTTNTNPQTWEIGYEAGFTGLESGQNGFCEDHNGDVWLTTALYVLKFNPEKLVQLQTQLVPTIRVANISYSTDNKEWNMIFFRDKNLQIAPTNKFIRIEYIANSISAPKSLRFKYRLKGFSDQWSNEIAYKTVDYTNLNYGRYQFEVKCSLDGEHWSQIAKTPEFEMLTPIWLRWYFISLYFLVFVLIIVAVTRYFVRQHQQRRMVAINRTKLENELQLSTLRSKVIPHFTKNVLSAIGYFAMTDKLKAGHYISLFSAFTQNTLANADKNYIALSEELSYIRNYLELEKMRFGDKFEFNIEIDDSVSLAILIPTMTLHTYCDNAIRHGLVNNERTGILTIKIVTIQDGVKISVEDNGIGRKRAEELGTHGNGQGLKLIQAQLDFYNQINEHSIIQKIIDLEDSDGQSLGTKIELFIPFNYRFTAN
jgi:ligand-binding sensor domain-containing protein